MTSTPAAAHRRRALALEFRGRYGEAVAAYHEALRCDPEDADALIRLGVLLRELGRDEEANQAFEAALTPRRPDGSGSGNIKP